jgi:hypothetical protein
MNLDIEDEPPIADATAADVHAALSRLTSSGQRFAVLKRAPYFLIQAYAEDAGDLYVQYWDGGRDRMYEASPQSPPAVVDAFLSYLNGDNRWRTAFEWRHMDNEE